MKQDKPDFVFPKTIGSIIQSSVGNVYGAKYILLEDGFWEFIRKDGNGAHYHQSLLEQHFLEGSMVFSVLWDGDWANGESEISSWTNEDKK